MNRDHEGNLLLEKKRNNLPMEKKGKSATFKGPMHPEWNTFLKTNKNKKIIYGY